MRLTSLGAARNKFDEEARVNLKLAKQRLSVFNGNWLDDRNLFTNLCGLKASNSKKQLKKIKGKVRYDLKLADAIEHEFKDLDKDTREVRLLEYARMMKLSKVSWGGWGERRTERSETKTLLRATGRKKHLLPKQADV
jgi:hypothetical protein